MFILKTKIRMSLMVLYQSPEVMNQYYMMSIHKFHSA